MEFVLKHPHELNFSSHSCTVTSLAKYQYECEIFDKINNEEKMVIFILHCIESLHIIGQLIKIALIFYVIHQVLSTITIVHANGYFASDYSSYFVNKIVWLHINIRLIIEG